MVLKMAAKRGSLTSISKPVVVRWALLTMYRAEI
jgi:hypothetical protein